MRFRSLTLRGSVTLAKSIRPCLSRDRQGSGSRQKSPKRISTRRADAGRTVGRQVRPRRVVQRPYLNQRWKNFFCRSGQNSDIRLPTAPPIMLVSMRAAITEPRTLAAG